MYIYLYIYIYIYIYTLYIYVRYIYIIYEDSYVFPIYIGFFINNICDFCI